MYLNLIFYIYQLSSRTFIDFIPKSKFIYDDHNFVNIKYIASEAYGNIYSAYSKKDKIYIYLKQINLNRIKENYKQLSITKSYINELNNEITFLKIFSYYENSLKYYGHYNKENEKIIILEKYDEDLEKYMKNRKKSLNIKEIREIFKGLNVVFRGMNMKNIIHRDLKLKNLLVKYKDNNKQNFIVKIGDYGIGKFLEKSDSITGSKGAPETMAPEIIFKKSSKYENLVDIFSLGVILYQLTHNLNHPFDNNDFQRKTIYYNKYEADNFEIQFDDSIKNEDFKDLVKRMLKLNPKNRLNWDQYFNHPFFN